MTSPAQITRLALIAAELSGPSSWPAFVSQQPVSPPDDVLSVYDTGGGSPLQMEDGLRRPTVQVRVRSRNYQTGWDKADAIARDLVLESPMAINTAADDDPEVNEYVTGFFLQGDIFFAGHDSEGLFLFTVNFEMIRSTET